MIKLKKLMGLMLIGSAFLAASCDNSNEPEPGDGAGPVFKIQTENEVEQFYSAQRRTFTVTAENIADTEVVAPEGWQAKCEEDVLTVVSPSASDENAQTEGEVTVNYVGTNGTKGTASMKVELVASDDPDQPEGPRYPEPGEIFHFQTYVPDFSNTVSFSVYPDNQEYPYWVTLDNVLNFESFGSLDEYVKDDLEYWNSTYGDLGMMCFTGDLLNTQVNDLPNGAYVLIAYYYDAETGTAINPTVSEYFTVNGSSSGGDVTNEPYLGLSYELDYGREGWDALLGIPTTGKCIVVSSPDPNSAVAGWYYGLFSKANIDGAYNSDEAIRKELKSNEAFHNQPLIVNVVDFGTQWVLCGFWVDAQGNDGPVERIPFTATMGESANWKFVDYEGVWTVSGTNLNGKKVSYDVTFEENMYGESFKVFGFTQTGYDRKYNAPVRVRYNDGILEFYESSLLGMDGDGNWMGFCGFIDNPEKLGAYASVNNNSTIAKAVRENNTMRLTWQNATISGFTEPFVTFSYGQMYDEYGDEYCVPYDEDLEYFIVKDMQITLKSMPSGARMKSPTLDKAKARLAMSRMSTKHSVRK